MKKVLLILIISTLSISCSKNKVYEKRFEFEKYTWNRFLPVYFEFPIHDNTYNYNIYLTSRHITQYPYDNLKVNLTIYSPSGDERTSMHVFQVKDKDGKFLGDGMGDLWDLKLLVKQNISFKDAGNYKIQIDNLMDYYDIVGLMNIGVIVEKSQKITNE
jgi:gliding motility-associated lipoprotein GldH